VKDRRQGGHGRLLSNLGVIAEIAATTRRARISSRSLALRESVGDLWASAFDGESRMIAVLQKEFEQARSGSRIDAAQRQLATHGWSPTATTTSQRDAWPSATMPLRACTNAESLCVYRDYDDRWRLLSARDIGCSRPVNGDRHPRSSRCATETIRDVIGAHGRIPRARVGTKLASRRWDVRGRQADHRGRGRSLDLAAAVEARLALCGKA